MQKFPVSSERALVLQAGAGMRMAGVMTTGTGSTTRSKRGPGPS
jgi:hypothetical protein